MTGYDDERRDLSMVDDSVFRFSIDFSKLAGYREKHDFLDHAVFFL